MDVRRPVNTIPATRRHFPDSSASALILDPGNGQILALVGETIQGVETPLVTAHKPGPSWMRLSI